MNVYKTNEVRNVVFLGHGSAGKTTLTEAVGLLTKVIDRMGNVSQGSTLSDFDKEEQKRGFSLSASLLQTEWNGIKINVIDTPGYFDFVGEAEEGLSAADAAVIVVSGKSGVEPGTKKAWELCEKMQKPRMIFVTEMDLPDANYFKVLEELKMAFGRAIAPIAVPVREDGKLIGYVNAVKNVARRYTDVGMREDRPAIPDSVKDIVSKTRGALMEAVAETSEELMERYFNGEEFTDTEILEALKENVAVDFLSSVHLFYDLKMQKVIFYFSHWN